jgi:16S rRNA (cytidine1402-2'-O)-methyltransferase
VVGFRSLTAVQLRCLALIVSFIVTLGMAMAGTLYVVSTPIGHIEDITYRAVRVLKSVDLIAAEEPSVTKTFLNHYGIETPITSYHAPNLDEKVDVLLTRLRGGQCLALVCDAGTPVICDPGYRLVDAATRTGITVVPLPGPSAALAAVPVSALPGDSFFFQGPVPLGVAARRRMFQRLQDLRSTLILFESADRLEATLRAVRRLLGNRQVVVASELTKSHEHFVRGRVDEVVRALAGHNLGGEVTLLIEGKPNRRRK